MISAEILLQNATDTMLDISHIQLEYLDMLKIRDFLNEHPKITYLKAAYCGINAVMAQVLAELKYITTLNLANNEIGDEGIAALAKNEVFSAVVFSCNNISAQGAIALAKHDLLTSVILNFNMIGDEGAAAFEDHRYIVNLHLDNCGVSDEGVKILAKNDTIRILNLSNNFVSNEGARALEKNDILEVLYLHGNEIEEIALKSLLIKPNLKYTNAQLNNISDEFSDFLAHANVTDIANMAISLNQSVTVPSLSKLCLFKIKEQGFAGDLNDLDCSFVDRYILKH